MFQTRMTETLGVKYPIQCGTMMHISNAEFVAACANAGIFACLASAMFRDEETLVNEIRSLREMTDKPFGVNVSLFPGHDARTVDVTLDILNREKISIIETAGRSPEPFLEKIRVNKPIHLHKCARLKDAIKADKLGVDMVTVVGAECGGHPGMEDISTMVLVPEVVSQISAPLIAGGGFCDGNGLMAALSLGAEGVLMGTRFLNTIECRVNDGIKQALLDAGLTDTMIIQRSIGAPVRVLKNEWAMEIAEMEEKGATLKDLMPKISGQLSGEAWITGGADAVFSCGQVVGRSKETIAISVLVEEIMRQAEDSVKRLKKTHAE